ncbi:hypothetical protein ACWD4T_02985 [Streptomyces umbrinus]
MKPHASPVLHAINYLLGELDSSCLPRLSEFGGLQGYPSRFKDPDLVGRHHALDADSIARATLDLTG